MAAPKGNQNAAKAKVWSAAIGRALDRRKPANKRIKAIDELADKLLDACAEGSLPALQELGNRLEGKPHQSMEINANIHQTADSLSDDELADIAAGGSAGTTKPKGGKKKPAELH